MSGTAVPPGTGTPPGNNGGTGGAADGNPNPPNGGTQPATPPAQNPPAQTPPNPQPQPQTPPPAPSQPVFTAEQQAAINAIAARARDEGREAAKKELERQNAEQQGQFKTLYEQAKPEADKVPVLTQQVTALQERIHTQIDGEVKDWPAEVKAIDPGKTVPLEQREQWVSTHRAIAERLKAGQTPPNPEAGGGSQGGGNNETVDANKVVDNYLKRYSPPGAKTTA